jgi:4-diphosphocytidyl-2-C-methyl-D-erythritol kinase
MICFPNAKINLGLQVKKKRSDGYHDIETIFYPLGLSDILEVTPAAGIKGGFDYSNTGIEIDTEPVDNLCIRAWREITGKYDLPGIAIHLHKVIPPGAGLGGGSSDAAHMLKALNELFSLGIPLSDLETMAGRIGSDCPFFLHNRPVCAKGRGEILEPVELDLSGLYILVVHPGISVSTGRAYAGIKPGSHSESLAGIVGVNPREWQGRLINDFEPLVFNEYPVIREIKDRMLSLGAIYGSMTGSGSAVYGLFDFEPEAGHMSKAFPGMFIWKGKL